MHGFFFNFEIFSGIYLAGFGSFRNLGGFKFFANLAIFHSFFFEIFGIRLILAILEIQITVKFWLILVISGILAITPSTTYYIQFRII